MRYKGKNIKKYEKCNKKKIKKREIKEHNHDVSHCHIGTLAPSDLHRLRPLLRHIEPALMIDSLKLELF